MESDDSDATEELSASDVDMGSDGTEELSDGEIERMRADWQARRARRASVTVDLTEDDAQGQQQQQQQQPSRPAAAAAASPAERGEQNNEDSGEAAAAAARPVKTPAAVQQLASILSVDNARAARLMALCGSVEAAIAHHFSGVGAISPGAGASPARESRVSAPEPAAAAPAATEPAARQKAGGKAGGSATRGAGSSRKKAASGAAAASAKGAKRPKLSDQQHSITSFFSRGSAAAGPAAATAASRRSPGAPAVKPEPGTAKPEPGTAKTEPATAKTEPAAVKLGPAAARTGAGVDAGSTGAASGGWGLERSDRAEDSKEPTRNARWMMAHKPDDIAKQGAGAAAGAAAAAAVGGRGTHPQEQQEQPQQPLSTSLWEFSPSDYVRHWGGKGGGEGKNAPYSLLAEAFSTLEGTTGRTLSVTTLCNAFRCLITADRASLVPALYLCIDKIAPSYSADVAPISVGYSILSKAIMEATGAQKASLREKAVAFGDLGDAAVAVKASQRTLSFGRAASKPLLIDGIDGQIGLFHSLHSISRERGSGAQERKRAVIARLLVAAKGMETKYVVRTLEGQLRVGSAKKTILKALASAFALTPAANGEAGKTVGGYIEGSSSARERKRLEAAMSAANTAAQDCFAQVRIFTNGRFVSNVPHVCPEPVLANRAVFIEKPNKGPTLDCLKHSSTECNWCQTVPDIRAIWFGNSTMPCESIMDAILNVFKMRSIPTSRTSAMHSGSCRKHGPTPPPRLLLMVRTVQGGLLTMGC
jgi:hypothetical protein